MEAVEGSRKRKRGAYEQYSDEVRTKIARYAIDNGVAKTSRRFTADLGKRVSETTVRSMRDAYVNLKKSIGSEPTLLTRSPRGAPTILGRYDEMVQQFIRRTRANGGVVNIRTVTAAAEGILKKFAKHRLRQFGGPVVIDKSLARSILRRMGFVKRKGTKATKTLPSDFAAIQQGYVSKVEKFVRDHAIPDSLVLNFDQTGCHMVPGGEWTMEERGTDQITIAGLDDKRQMTVLLTATKSGGLLPPQLIYAGKTERCLPKGVEFPAGWDIAFTESHWSTGDSMMRYAKEVLIPYVSSIRESLPLSQCDQPALVLFDFFRAHQGTEFHQLLRENGIFYTFVRWYSDQVVSLLEDAEVDTVANVDLRTSTLKPLHATGTLTVAELDRLSVAGVVLCTNAFSAIVGLSVLSRSGTATYVSVLWE